MVSRGKFKELARFVVRQIKQECCRYQYDIVDVFNF